MEAQVDENIEIETKLGYKKTKLGWIPEEWEVLRMEEFCQFTQGVQIPFSEQRQTPDKGWIRYLYIRDFFSNKYPCYVKDEWPEKIMYPKDIMMVNTGNTAGTVYSGATGVLSNNAFKITFSPEKVDRNYFLLFLTSPRTQTRIQRFFNSGGQPHVGHKNVALVQAPLPPLPEQRAIARTLSTWDKAISTLQKLIAKKQERKEGLMQVMLTGKKRFEGFDEEWKEMPIDEIFEFLSTTSFSRKDLEYSYNLDRVKYIHYGDIHATYDQIILNLEANNSIPVLKESVKRSSNTAFLKEGDLIVADASEDYKGVADCIELKNVGDQRVIAGLHTFALRDKSGLTEQGVRGYLLKAEKVVKRLREVATGSKVYGISKKNLAVVTVQIPSKVEQKRIASLLSTADREIEKLQGQLEKLKEQKKGMMQRLLTGEVRVKIN